jgi:hypothetical protein
MRKPKKNARISSNDSNGNAIQVAVEFTSTNELEKDEVEEVTRQAARAVADIIRKLPYTNFGPENTRITF